MPSTRARGRRPRMSSSRGCKCVRLFFPSLPKPFPPHTQLATWGEGSFAHRGGKFLSVLAFYSPQDLVHRPAANHAPISRVARARTHDDDVPHRCHLLERRAILALALKRTLGGCTRRSKRTLFLLAFLLRVLSHSSTCFFVPRRGTATTGPPWRWRSPGAAGSSARSGGGTR
jgi:hypothetical protein